MKYFLIFVLFVSTHGLAAKPPEAAIAQMQVVATVQAAIQFCFDSAEYKKLSAADALKFHNVNSMGEEIIQKIEKRYGDDLAYIAVIVASLEIGESSEFKRSFAKKYSRKCSQQLLLDSVETLNIVNKRVNFLINKDD
jgi:hypothetical protein